MPQSKPALKDADIERGYRKDDAADKAKALRLKSEGKSYKLADYDRLYLLIGKNTKTWYWAYRFQDKDGLVSLGRWPDVSTDEARTLRVKKEKLLKDGINPAEEKKAQQEKSKVDIATTFAGVAKEWIGKKAFFTKEEWEKLHGPDKENARLVENAEKRWSEYYSQQVRNFMDRYVINAPIGASPIKSITAADIAALVGGVADRKQATGDERKSTGAPSVALLLKQWCGKVFSLAITTGRYKGSNPAKDFEVSDVVTKPKTKHNKALDEKELPELLAALKRYTVKRPGKNPKSTRLYSGERRTVIAIELLLLTCVRTAELRKAQWHEFDLQNGLWMIPGERMKMGLPHVVPLSKQAIALLEELRFHYPPPKDGPQWLFANRRRGSVDCMSATTINRALQVMGFNDENLFRAHGVRGTASTYLNGADFEPLQVEAVLAHKTKGIAGIYNQQKYVKQRREMLQHYADYLDSLVVSGQQSVG